MLRHSKFLILILAISLLLPTTNALSADTEDNHLEYDIQETTDQETTDQETTDPETTDVGATGPEATDPETADLDEFQAEEIDRFNVSGWKCPIDSNKVHGTVASKTVSKTKNELSDLATNAWYNFKEIIDSNGVYMGTLGGKYRTNSGGQFQTRLVNDAANVWHKEVTSFGSTSHTTDHCLAATVSTDWVKVKNDGSATFSAISFM